jgi:hypothetical protein
VTHTITRVRHQDGRTLGWYDSKSFAVLADSDPGFRLMAYWRTNRKEDQEDYGVPPAGYFTAYGYWLPVEG